MDPILIVGSPRTGTTALALGLKAAGISGFAEGHLLMLFVRIEQAISKYYQDEASNNLPGTLLHAMSMPKIAKAYRELARTMLDDVHGNKPWFDKTAHGGTVGALPFFRSVWPRAKIIFTKRRPIENLRSRLKKFPHMSFAEHCADLRYIFMTWAKMREQLDDWLEVDQYDLIMKCQATSERLSQFLLLGADSADALRQTLLSTHPERSAPTYEPLKFSNLEWDTTNKDLFHKELDPVMTLYRYGYENYYLQEPDSRTAC